ncbi:mRNA splicing protein SLU7 ASCRUDRAFT_79959 [Ascoidea rubescens DSM 1968]|uniref:Pre-mRNA-splicing factor SLU7 n=1 Tax=Ascoidea rubescens DSM 1968 TaxID=1344418 RepID=A0A1D2VLG0_9ASCO|nr:hypothetical protein ASCRUDRAFT_79959 [Ascoidea rubescens DSM 1968]ODV62441.1 hypothetical protein ASCRUDRAFT_79959 [Ascoidea rubescens DSM 1968]
MVPPRTNNFRKQGKTNQSGGRNQYIPKFISVAPWYKESNNENDNDTIDEDNYSKNLGGDDDDGNKEKKDYLAHQRNDPTLKPKNFAISKHGFGINDLFEEIVDENIVEFDKNRNKNKNKRNSKTEKFNKNKRNKRFNSKNGVYCTNCGSVNHIKKDCLERPNKININFREKEKEEEDNDADDLIFNTTNHNIPNNKKPRKEKKNIIRIRKEEADNYNSNKKDNYDSRRDRWYGYDISNWESELKTWEENDIKKKEKLKLEEIDRLIRSIEKYDGEPNDDSFIENTELYFNSSSDEEIELQELGLLENDFKSKIDSEKASGEKIIRILEDKASYLYGVNSKPQKYNENEDIELSYNPKTRSIRDVNTGYINNNNLFVRHLNGEAAEYEKLKTFAWDSNKRAMNQMLQMTQLSETEEPQNGSGSNSNSNSIEGEAVSKLDPTNHPEASPTAFIVEMKKKKEELGKKSARQSYILRYL